VPFTEVLPGYSLRSILALPELLSRTLRYLSVKCIPPFIPGMLKQKVMDTVCSDIQCLGPETRKHVNSSCERINCSVSAN
jgi:hypothetical protein